MIFCKTLQNFSIFKSSENQRKRPKNQWFLGLFGGDKRDRTADLLNAIHKKILYFQWFADFCM